VGLNDNLVEIYQKYWPNLLNVISEDDITSKKIHYPLLINIPQEYEKMPKKLFVVGQQTRGGRKGVQHLDINELMLWYKDFNLGQKKGSSPFWYACHLLHQTLNPSAPKYGFVWSNLIKIDEKNKRPSPDLEEKICSAFPVLPLEIEVAHPDIVVFFTGPNYDSRLKKTFNGLILEPMEGYKPRTFARIVHKMLPYNSFRVYHPVYINRSKPYQLHDIYSEINASLQKPIPQP
jgi:hypothetical protein